MSRTTSTALLHALVGAVSGVVATGPMTAAMIALHRRLPSTERQPLPPGQIVAKLAGRTGAHRVLANEEAGVATSLLAHFGYGGAVGALYGFADDVVPVGPISKGIGFGLLVWGGSYLGLLPGAGILEPAWRHPNRRNALMIAAHAVWGVTLALFVDLLDGEARRLAAAPGPELT